MSTFQTKQFLLKDIGWWRTDVDSRGMNATEVLIHFGRMKRLLLLWRWMVCFTMAMVAEMRDLVGFCFVRRIGEMSD